MKRLKVKIKGTKPLLMNKFVGDTEDGNEKVTRGKKDYGTPQEQAEKVTYLDKKGKVYVPWTWIAGTLKTVASDFKSSISKRKSLKAIIGGAALFEDEKIYFTDGFTKEDFEVHTTPVVIKGSRISRHRPKFDSWELEFTLALDSSLVTLPEFTAVLEDAGRRAGIGDYRISKGGPFGTFKVLSIKEIKFDKKAAA